MLRGAVTRGSGNVAPDATVEIHNAAGDVVDQVQVDAQGRFEFHVTPGSWGLRAWDPHGRRARSPAEVAEREVEVELRLEPEERRQAS
jgi:hypothetical protein